MKYLSYYIVFTALVIISCKKTDYPADWKEEKNDINISLDKNVIKQNEYLTFNFGGYADSIIIYNGTVGSEYKYKDRTVLEGVKPSMSFSSYSQWGAQQNTLKVLVSYDFKGKNYDGAEINAASWTADITSRFVLSTGTDNTLSGNVNLADLVKNGQNIYFAFKFTGTTGTTQKTWTIKNFVIKNELPNGAVQDVATIGTAGWKQFSFKGSAQVWTFNATQLQIAGGNETNPDNEDWLISKGFNFSQVSPDQPSHMVKTRFQNMVKSYRLGYAKAGSYQLTVVAKDKNGVEIKHETFNITVNEN